MGIPKLMQDLLPYAEEAVIGCRNTDFSGPAEPLIRKIVVDGPSLVYYIYSRLYPRCHGPTAGVDAQPSYTDVNLGVVEFLTTLTDRQVDIEGIYFDGALPIGKQATRLERLEKARALLDSYRKQYPGPFKPSSSTKSPGDVSGLRCSIWRKRFAPPRKQQLPPPPFLVACVLDDLRKDITHNYPLQVVPGEADVYCATTARTTGAAIFSNDSDMTLYNLGTEGSLVLLDSLELISKSDCDLNDKSQRHTLKAQRLHPASIARRLNLNNPAGKPSLLRYGFERVSDPSALAGTIRLRSISPHSTGAEEAFHQFCDLYENTKETGYSEYTISPLALLDPRVSELYCQCNFAEYRAKSMHGPQIYMPLLIEDSTRDSSWTYGKALRILAYSLIMHSAGNAGNLQHHDCVIEFQRRGPRIVGLPLKLLNKVDLISSANTITGDLTKHVSGVHSPLGWRIFALSEVSKERSGNGKPTIPNGWATEFLSRGYVSGKLSWDDIHVYANMQAVLYSLWILQQACAVSKPYKDLQPAVDNLRHAFQSLAPLKDLMASRWEVSDASSNLEDAVVNEALGLAGMRSIAPEQNVIVSNAERRPNNGTELATSKVIFAAKDQRRRANGNIFELLDSF